MDGHSREKKKTSYVGLYGSARVLKSYCNTCGAYAFVNDGRLACCDSIVDIVANIDGTIRTKRESQGAKRKAIPNLIDREAILRQQEDRCIYCGLEFGAFVVKLNARVCALDVCWDHVVPYAYDQNNAAYNFVAACQICNGIKNGHIFESIEMARAYIMRRRKKKVYDEEYEGPRQ